MRGTVCVRQCGVCEEGAALCWPPPDSRCRTPDAPVMSVAVPTSDCAQSAFPAALLLWNDRKKETRGVQMSALETKIATESPSALGSSTEDSSGALLTDPLD
jgi:hypothetical protein